MLPEIAQDHILFCALGMCR